MWVALKWRTIGKWWAGRKELNGRGGSLPSNSHAMAHTIQISNKAKINQGTSGKMNCLPFFHCCNSTIISTETLASCRFGLNWVIRFVVIWHLLLNDSVYLWDVLNMANYLGHHLAVFKKCVWFVKLLWTRQIRLSKQAWRVPRKKPSQKLPNERWGFPGLWMINSNNWVLHICLSHQQSTQDSSLKSPMAMKKNPFRFVWSPLAPSSDCKFRFIHSNFAVVCRDALEIEYTKTILVGD